MSRDLVRFGRPFAVWLVVGGATAAAAASAPAAWRDAVHAVGSDRPIAVLVAGCTSVLVVGLGRLWLLTTVAVRDLARGCTPDARTATRRLVLLACGAAVAAGTALPAHAGGGDARGLLTGLALPERAVARAADPPVATPALAPYVVRRGDSLWSIAVAHPGDGDTDERWRAIWAANHAEVGDDPDVIHPGQVLRLPATDQDGAR
ncbi:hypothetical protein F4692_002620 [Nocardioides cavernae]|uniref:LysM domain-containing protein n=1 Tax=Nocardioides cavernae TaxID=1921566 RepID=A0A7Y9H3V9_9ACTN|nr:LysM peptidoglycan-binding domain-containing protein [Nocardioides cavernae]NYE37487.1 hypothetical protein [Nocardioides cavernae]